MLEYQPVPTHNLRKYILYDKIVWISLLSLSILIFFLSTTINGLVILVIALAFYQDEKLNSLRLEVRLK